MDARRLILKDSQTTADTLTGEHGGRPVPDCSRFRCRYMTTGGDCALPVCKDRYPESPQRLARWAVGKIVSQLMSTGGGYVAISAELGISEDAVRAARAIYATDGWEWIVDKSNGCNGYRPTVWARHGLSGPCSRKDCTGTLLPTDDGPTCSMCARRAGVLA